MSEQEKKAAEDFAKKHQFRRAPMLDEVLRAYQAARAADSNPIGGAASGFAERVLAPKYAQFRAQASQTSDAISVAHLCLIYLGQFKEAAGLPFAEKQGLAARVALSQVTAAAPAQAAFSAPAFVARLASQGVTLAPGPNGEILCRGLMHPQTRELIKAHRKVIAAFLETPPEVI